MPDRSYDPPPERRETRERHEFREEYDPPPRPEARQTEELVLTWVWAVVIVIVVAVLVWFVVTRGEPIVW